MSSTEITTPRLRLPRQRVPSSLAPGALACRDCGDAVAVPRSVERLLAYGRERVTGPGLLVMDERMTELAMTRCDGCADRLDRAGALLDTYPRIARSLGSRSYALNLVEASLSALDALGVKARHVDSLASTARDLQLLIKYLPAAGAAARWSARFVPVISHDAEPGTCAPSRWAHMTTEQGQALRDSYGALLRARTDKPRAVPPPNDGLPGCLLCGVGAVIALSSHAADAWGPLRKVNPATLGGRGRPEPVVGHLCAVCSPVVDRVGRSV